jgi:hypothetical protein
METLKHRFSPAWEKFKKDFPDRETKSITIHNQSKIPSFCFVESGKLIRLFPSGTYSSNIIIPPFINLL